MTVNFQLQRNIPPLEGPSRRFGYGDGCADSRQLARGRRYSDRPPYHRPARPAPGRFPLPANLWRRLLLHALAQPLLAALPQWPQGRPPRALAGDQSADGLPTAGTLFQGGPSTSPPPNG